MRRRGMLKAIRTTCLTGVVKVARKAGIRSARGQGEATEEGVTSEPTSRISENWVRPPMLDTKPNILESEQLRLLHSCVEQSVEVLKLYKSLLPVSLWVRLTFERKGTHGTLVDVSVVSSGRRFWTMSMLLQLPLLDVERKLLAGYGRLPNSMLDCSMNSAGRTLKSIWTFRTR